MKDHDAFYRHVGERIRLKRGKILSQADLATAIGLTRTSISNIESGRQKLLLHTLVDIAEALNVEVANLLPERPVASVELVGAKALADLPETERAFIQSAIGIPLKGIHGRQEKEDSGAGRDTSSGS